MEGILLILLVLAAIAFASPSRGGGRGIVVKDNPESKKPKIGAAPQGIKPKKEKRNKQGRTKDEQELHEWLEDNPR